MPGVTYKGFLCHEKFPEPDKHIIEDIYVGDAYRTRLIASRGKGEVVVDVGAHIGAFSRLWYEKNPLARIFSVECNPENLPYLETNVGDFATVVPAACTYEQGGLVLLNTIGETCPDTGSSRLVKEEDAPQVILTRPELNWHIDRRPIRVITLHELMDFHGLRQIDALKLDCEHSEESILEYGPMDKIRYVFMETHDPAKWRDLWKRMFSDWQVGHMVACPPFELWHLKNPRIS